jgi:hypothetical protein
MVAMPRLSFEKRILVVLIVLCIQSVTSFWGKENIFEKKIAKSLLAHQHIEQNITRGSFKLTENIELHNRIFNDLL